MSVSVSPHNVAIWLGRGLADCPVTTTNSYLRRESAATSALAQSMRNNVVMPIPQIASCSCVEAPMCSCFRSASMEEVDRSLTAATVIYAAMKNLTQHNIVCKLFKMKI